jgi:hypothetical protein
MSNIVDISHFLLPLNKKNSIYPKNFFPAQLHHEQIRLYDIYSDLASFIKLKSYEHKKGWDLALNKYLLR